MQIQETFTVPYAKEHVWDFFQDLKRVMGCVPGVEAVEVQGPDRYKVRASQKVGFISAVFELETEIVRRSPGQFMELSSVGRSIRGAAGHLRFTNRLQFAEAEGGGTRVDLSSEVALGGMLGALGHKVIVAKAREITEKFAGALQAEIEKWASEART